ncbi:hypothetical protein QBC40DRAFT_21306 [Triangularia verruculosa]|uniref:Uncharacterized protein n=1 Tax=Triangularia verruculosa TaxID=2587418 RepID=A0AAN7AXV7_9PEZI|nr:hypothetical protein QBC40DRAFT_21306 [Triangularia verruculosa]
MSSFRSHRLSLPDRTLRKPQKLRSSPKLDEMEDIVYDSPSSYSKNNHLGSQASSTSTLVPSEGGSLLDYFDLPSPPSTPVKATHQYGSLNSFQSPALSPEMLTTSLSPPSSPSPRRDRRSRPSTGRPRSHSRSSSSSSVSSSSSATMMDVDSYGGGGEAGVTPMVRSSRRTPYYPPNSSRSVDRARVYMNRGPHYVPNWTPMSSLPRHVQLQIEERMVKFTA